jgi:glutamate synthase (NADPH/NADH) small chain
MREYSVLSKEFIGENGCVKQIKAVRLKYSEKDPTTGRRSFSEIEGSEFLIDADLVLLAMGFLGPVKSGMIEQLGVDLDARGNIKTGEDRMSSLPGVFAAGDMRIGQSLVVRAINEGRTTAFHVNQYLK